MLIKILAFFIALAGFISVICSFYFWLKTDLVQGMEIIILVLLFSGATLTLTLISCFI